MGGVEEHGRDTSSDCIVAAVVSQRGHCEAGHRVGDTFVIGQTTPGGLCTWALVALFPFAQVLQFGGKLPWEPDALAARVACPDPDNPVVFELRRISGKAGQ